MLDDALERGTGREPVDDVVTELTELVEDDIVLVQRELVATVVDLLDVGLGARGLDDVALVDDPVFEPVETLTAHSLG